MRLIPACLFVPRKSSTISSGRSPTTAGTIAVWLTEFRLMAGDGKVRGIDIGDAWWQDIDTPRVLEHAERHSWTHAERGHLN